jgi:hypothetical protein
MKKIIDIRFSMIGLLNTKSKTKETADRRWQSIVNLKLNQIPRSDTGAMAEGSAVHSAVERYGATMTDIDSEVTYRNEEGELVRVDGDIGYSYPDNCLKVHEAKVARVVAEDDNYIYIGTGTIDQLILEPASGLTAKDWKRTKDFSAYTGTKGSKQGKAYGYLSMTVEEFISLNFDLVDGRYLKYIYEDRQELADPAETKPVIVDGIDYSEFMNEVPIMKNTRVAVGHHDCTEFVEALRAFGKFKLDSFTFFKVSPDTLKLEKNGMMKNGFTSYSFPVDYSTDNDYSVEIAKAVANLQARMAGDEAVRIAFETDSEAVYEKFKLIIENYENLK